VDPISIFRAVWRHKLATIPVILLTCLAAFYVVAIKAPVYQAMQSFAIVNPPAPPTPAQVAVDPKLGKLNIANPFLQYNDSSAVPQIVVSLVGTSSSKQALATAGAGTQWQIVANTTEPDIIDVTGVGKTAQAALIGADLVTKAAENDLYQMQVNEGVNPKYMIKSYPLNTPTQASKESSSKLRLLVAVLGIGILLLFITISIAEATRKTKKQEAESFVPNRIVSEPGRGPQRFDHIQPIEAQGRREYRSGLER
jgi:hypothetical protein